MDMVFCIYGMRYPTCLSSPYAVYRMPYSVYCLLPASEYELSTLT